jgi:hypothetical protein
LDTWEKVRIGELSSLPPKSKNHSLMDLSVELANRMLTHCNFCRWDCKVDRSRGIKHGTCQLESTSRIGSYFHHRGEEIIFRGDYAELSDTIVEGSVETNIYAYAFDTASGTTEMCVSVFQYDASTDTSLISFYGCGPADEFTVANGLGDATFSGTVTGFDYATGEEKTVTVSADLTATGKVQTSNYRQGSTSPDFKFVSTFSGSNRPASGSLDISGDITVSSDDATGIIAKTRSGSITITG